MGEFHELSGRTLMQEMVADYVSRADGIKRKGGKNMVLIAGVRRYDDGRAFQILYGAIIERNAVFFRVFAFQDEIQEVIEEEIDFSDFFVLGLFLVHNISYKRVCFALLRYNVL